MKLSMEIIADKLFAYSPEAAITDGGMAISGARLLSTAGTIRRDIIYITPARGCIDDMQFDDCALCVHGRDWIKLKSAEADEVLAAVLDIFEEFNAWEATLREAVDCGWDMQRLIDASKRVLPFPIFIADALGNVVGYSGEYGEGEVDIFWDAIVSSGKTHERMFAGSLTDDQSRVIYDWDATPRIYNTPQRRIIGLHLMQNGDPIGAITIIEKGRKLSDGVCQISGVFREAASKAIGKRGQDAELRTVAAIIRDYLDGKNVDKELIWKHIRTNAGQQNDELELILLRNIKRADINYKSNMSFRLAGVGVASFCMPYEDFILVIIACVNQSEFLQKVRSLLSGDEYLCGVSLPLSSVESIPNALSQAKLAIKIGVKTPGAVNKCVDYAYGYLIDRLAEDIDATTGLLHPALAALRKYDAKHRTSLYVTLYEYLRLERNVVATSKHLFIHRNSMIYRLQRIEKLLDLNLDDINVRMYLVLSYHIDMNTHTFIKGGHESDC